MQRVESGRGQWYSWMDNFSTAFYSHIQDEDRMGREYPEGEIWNGNCFIGKEIEYHKLLVVEYPSFCAFFPLYFSSH
jgi:hypothetical protein